MSQPIIYCIHAADAPQHLGKLQQLCQKFKDQKRIADFIAVPTDAAKGTLDGKVQGNDVIVLLLTRGLETTQSEIESLFSNLRSKMPDVVIAEIIIDNIQYENEYITLPIDLKPIRDRQDMDKAWIDIEENLEKLLPHKRTPAPIKKYLIPIAALAVIALLVWLVPKLFGGKPEPNFSFKIMDIKSGRILTDTAACYLPCLVSFNDESKNHSSVRWDFGDTTLTDPNPDYLFIKPGEHTITLTALKGSSEKKLPKTLLVKAPPFADFDTKNDGCIAPCQIEFTNKSNGKSFSWQFGDNSPISAEENPKKDYATPGAYTVLFTVTNEDNLKKDTAKIITVRQDNSPFAQFTITKTGVPGSVPRLVKFENASKNADQFIWNFGDGTNGVSSAGSPGITHTYNTQGSYTVVLTAKQNNRESTAANGFYIGRAEVIRHYEYIDRQILRRVGDSRTLRVENR